MDVPLTWFLMRTTGTVALVSLTIAVVVGLIGPRLSPPARLTTVTLHRVASATGTVLITGHVVFALVDQVVSIQVTDVIVPGTSAWERFGIGLGAVAIDLLAVIVLTSLIRSRMPRTWRTVHLAAVPMWLAAWWHAVSVGTDAPSASGRALAVASIALVALALAIRLQPRGQGHPPREQTGRDVAEPSPAPSLRSHR